MPVLSSERKSSPRSSLRHRPIDTMQLTPDPATTRLERPSSDPHTSVKPAPPDVPDLDDDEEEKVEEEEKAQPQRRAPSKPPRRATAVPSPRATVPLEPVKPRLHPLFFVGMGLMLAVLLWAGIGQAMIWGHNELNTLRYGYPRTYQIDAFVGIGDSQQHPSHFVALNLHGTITIVDFPAGDPSHAFILPTANVPGTDPDLAVVTLSFIDINHNGHPDMLVDIDGFQSVLVNDGKTFRPPTPAEQQQFLQYLRQHN